jgi:beta-lactamase class A
MIVRSDNVACDKLLALLGGPAVVDARVRKLGVDGVTIRLSEKEMGTGVDNSATPTAMVALLAKIARRKLGLSTRRHANERSPAGPFGLRHVQRAAETLR